MVGIGLGIGDVDGCVGDVVVNDGDGVYIDKGVVV